MSQKSKLKNLSQKNNLKYIYNTRKYLIWSVFFGLLTAVLIFASLIPQINSVSKLYGGLIKENKRLAQLKIKVAQLNDSTNSLIITNSDKVNQALPSKKPLLELLTALNLVGSEAKVLFKNISLTPGKISTQSAIITPTSSRNKKKTAAPTKKYETLHLDLDVAGKIANINDFLKKIEEIAPFSTVTAMALNEKTSNTENNFSESEFEAKLTISTYFYTRSINSNIDASLPELTVARREIIDELQKFTYTTIEEQFQIQGGGLENLFPGIGAIPI